MSQPLKFTVSAPGKIILFGEHSVVYGQPALAASINKRTTLNFETTEHEYIHLEFRNLHINVQIPLAEIKCVLAGLTSAQSSEKLIPQTHNADKFVELADRTMRKFDHLRSLNVNQQVSIQCFLYLVYGLFSTRARDVSTTFKITIVSELVVGAGSGSSASFSVCLAAALCHYLQCCGDGVQEFKNEFKEVVNEWAFACEQIIHGKASGLDNFVCTFGYIVEVNSLPEDRSKKTFKLLENVVQLRLLMIDSGVSRKTSLMVKKVAELRGRNTNVVDRIFEAMGEITKNASFILRDLKKFESDGDAVEKLYITLDDLVTVNQGLLASLGVSHSDLDNIINITSLYGLKSKLTGAGGGGYVITFVPPSVSKDQLQGCKDALSKANYTVDEVVIGDSGLQIELK